MSSAETAGKVHFAYALDGNPCGFGLRVERRVYIGIPFPVISFLITGMPYPEALIPMTAELSVYGISSGFLREKLNLNSFTSVAVALIFGRAVYLIIFFILSSGMGYSEYVFTAMVPGLAAGIMQIAILPFAAKLRIK